jgi:diketogulonate reductase-like aldo/keto reductase
MSTSSSSLSPTIKMADGHSIPRFGIGAWEMRGKETVDALRSAVEQVGYRHIE